MKTGVYFDTDKFDLRGEGKQTIDNTFDTLQNVVLTKIVLTGNTDNSADSLYNLKLSDNRVEAVNTYLLTKGINQSIISTDYFGEEKPKATNETGEGKQINRRVDILIFYKTEVIPKQTIAVDTIPKQILKTDTCKSDTTIILPEGTQVVFNRCEYFEIKECVEFTETNNPQAILVNGLSLMDTSGFPIASCGMLRVTLKPGCTNRECFKVPVKVRFPVPEDKECDYCGRDANLYDITNNGLWVQTPQSKKTEVKLVKVRGQMFYQFELFCPNGWNNCDCKIKWKKVKFKTKHSSRIITLKVTNDCPATVFEFKPKARKNIAIAKIPCRKGNKTVIATIVNSKGDTLILKQQLLNDLPKRTAFSKCEKIKGETIGKWLGVFPIAKRELYRKYIIKTNLLTKQE
ncbi:MAG: OmpA family protein [Bacteroidia bacterium]